MFLHIFLFPEITFVFIEYYQLRSRNQQIKCARTIFVPLTCIHVVQALISYVLHFINVFK